MQRGKGWATTTLKLTRRGNQAHKTRMASHRPSTFRKAARRLFVPGSGEKKAKGCLDFFLVPRRDPNDALLHHGGCRAGCPSFFMMGCSNDGKRRPAVSRVDIVLVMYALCMRRSDWAGSSRLKPS